MISFNNKQSPIGDSKIDEYLQNKELNLHAAADTQEAFTATSFVIVSTPTNYDPETNCFDTRSVEADIQQVLSINLDATMVIKSTIPVGYTKSSGRSRIQTILFSHLSF